MYIAKYKVQLPSYVHPAKVHFLFHSRSHSRSGQGQLNNNNNLILIGEKHDATGEDSKVAKKFASDLSQECVIS